MKASGLLIFFLFVQVNIFSQEIIIVGSTLDNGRISPACWENGQKQILPLDEYEAGTASDYLKLPDTLLIIGSVQKNAKTRPALWKDNTLVELSCPNEAGNVWLHKIKIAQDKIIILGRLQINNKLLPIVYCDGAYQLIDSDQYYDIVIFDVTEYEGKLLYTGGASLKGRRQGFMYYDGKEIPAGDAKTVITAGERSDADFYFAGYTDDLLCLWKNKALYAAVPRGSDGIIYDLAVIDGSLYSVFALADNDEIAFYYGVNEALNKPFNLAGFNYRYPFAARILGLKNKVPVICISQYNNGIIENYLVMDGKEILLR